MNKPNFPKMTADGRSVVELLDEAFEQYADRACLIDDRVKLSFEDVRSQSCQVGQALVSAGFIKGMKAAILSPNDPLVLVVAIGIIRAGGIWVPINARNSVEDNASVIEKFGCDALFFHSSMEDALPAISDAAGNPDICVCLDQNCLGHLALEQWTEGQPNSNPEVPVEPTDIVCIPMTGGTTGIPKAVALSNRNMNIVLRGLQYHAAGHLVKNLAAAPLTHVGGRMALAIIYQGGCSVVVQSMEPGMVLDKIEQEKITDIFAPPTAVYALLAHPDLEKADLSSLKAIAYGSAPMSIAKLKEAIDRIGPVMAGGFGQTESPTMVSRLAIRDHFIDGTLAPDERLRSVGKETIGSTIRIMDDDGNVMPTGERGEIVVKGDFVSEGYFEDPEATAHIRRDGWHLTGDIGYLDEDGFLYIVDRKKDMIITGGFNVYSAEVEVASAAYPGVRDIVVVGVPDEKWGEAVKAVVQADDPAGFDEEAFLDFTKERLGGVKAPKSVDVVEELPRTANAKIDKKAVRARYWEGAGRTI